MFRRAARTDPQFSSSDVKNFHDIVNIFLIFRNEIFPAGRATSACKPLY
jgi:hypothetical protein